MPKRHFTIVETATFTRLVKGNLSEEEYRALQIELARHPEIGKLIPESGGIRKLRWGAEGRGKSGGFRVIYYLASSEETVLMLYLYPKNVAEDLTKDQVRALSKLVKEEFK